MLCRDTVNVRAGVYLLRRQPQYSVNVTGHALSLRDSQDIVGRVSHVPRRVRRGQVSRANEEKDRPSVFGGVALPPHHLYRFPYLRAIIRRTLPGRAGGLAAPSASTARFEFANRPDGHALIAQLVASDAGIAWLAPAYPRPRQPALGLRILKGNASYICARPALTEYAHLP